jgi:hypothetical protein
MYMYACLCTRLLFVAAVRAAVRARVRLSFINIITGTPVATSREYAGKSMNPAFGAFGDPALQFRFPNLSPAIYFGQ